jgi:hypothetical protein
MKEWKVRQEVYRRLNEVTTDNLNKVDVVWRPETITEDALRHWDEEVDEWIYPGKSYFVAICYAHWISEDFHEDFYEVLDDPDLLPGDPHFLPYNQAKETYDEILSEVTYIEDGAMVSEVRNYYDEEMQL